MFWSHPHGVFSTSAERAEAFNMSMNFAERQEKNSSARPDPSSLSFLGNQPVADSRLGQQILRACCIGFDLLAKLIQVDTKIMRLIAGARAPDLFQELLVRQHSSGVLDQ